MARTALKQYGEARAKKLAELASIKTDLAGLENAAGEHLGKIAVRAGLADLGLDDATLAREFAAIAARFQAHRKASGADATPAAIDRAAAAGDRPADD